MGTGSSNPAMMPRNPIVCLCVALVAFTAACQDTAPPPLKVVSNSAATTIPAALVNPDSAGLAAAAPSTFHVVFVTSKGEIEIAIDRSLAPHGADRLHYLVVNGFFTGGRFFRVVRGFAAQFGLSGIPSVDKVFDTLTIPDDRRKITNARGTLVFAGHGPNSRSTQLFINTADNSQRLDAQGFAPLGRVVRGMDVVDQLESGYGEASNVQGKIMARGNDYLRVAFAELDTIVRATVK